MAAAKARRLPLQFSLRLEEPSALDKGRVAARAGGLPASDSQADSAVDNVRGSNGQQSGTSDVASSLHAAGTCAAASSTPEMARSNSSSSSSSSSSVVSASSSPSMQQTQPSSSSAPTAGVMQQQLQHQLLPRPQKPNQQQLRGARRPAQAQEMPQRRSSLQSEDSSWLPLMMVAGLPHVEMELVSLAGRRHTGLFMLDSGEGCKLLRKSSLHKVLHIRMFNKDASVCICPCYCCLSSCGRQQGSLVGCSCGLVVSRSRQPSLMRGQHIRQWSRLLSFVMQAPGALTSC
jgi:hypothetical protein